MNKQKVNYQGFGLQTLLLMAILLTNTHFATAQKDPTENKLSKYELSIDLVPIIDEGRFGKIYFKIKKFDGEQEKAAFRLGISKGTYFRWDDDLSSYPKGTVTSLDNFSHFDIGLFLGYEKYKKIGPVLTYYGIDITGKYFLEHRVPETSSEDQEIITLGICPFWGIKHYMLRNRISASFEIGWENSLSRNTNQYNGQVFYYYRQIWSSRYN